MLSVPYTIFHVTPFLLSEWRGVRTHKSRLKYYEIKIQLHYELHTK